MKDIIKSLTEARTKDERIEILSRVLIEELDDIVPEKTDSVKSITIWYDYSHHVHREVAVSTDNYNLNYLIKKDNPNFNGNHDDFRGLYF